MEWLAPRNVDEVRSFMGLAGYYRRFIRKFSRIGYIITSLKMKGKKFEWTEECATSFDKLKHFLTHALVLKIVDPNKEFLVGIYVYKEGIGGVLMQEGCVVFYQSRKLNEHEHNCVTHDLELEVIIHALKMWKHYILSMRFILMSDHSVLRYLFDQSNLNARQVRWISTLSEFDFEIRYINGKENQFIDALSRRV